MVLVLMVWASLAFVVMMKGSLGFACVWGVEVMFKGLCSAA